ncbi:hypothetical protein LFT48_22005 (plasmid) [Arthrobacter sp. FW305-123]|nr:hypothetical protein LFT48_22005 [Arthrobacter sp. FW305-123]
MTILNQLIDGLADDSTSTSSALRKFLVVGSRLKSETIKEWVQRELNGLGELPLEEYPSYRGPLKAPVEAMFTGPYGSWQKHFISREVVPDDGGFRSAHFDVYFNESLAELEHLAQSEGDPRQAWPTLAVARLEQWSQEGRAPRVEMHGIHSVEKIVTRPMLHGVIDAVRNKALMLALDLQASFPDAGEIGGPTVQNKEVGNVVKYSFQTNFYGGTNTVGQGENVTQNVTVGQGETVTQHVTVNQGDSDALMFALEKLGLALEDRTALSEALEQDGNKPGNAVKDFLGKLAAGAVKVAGAVASEPAIAAVKMAITGFTGIPVP